MNRRHGWIGPALVTRDRRPARKSRFGRLTWWTDPAWTDALLDRDGLRLHEWSERGQLTTVKASPFRTVQRVDEPHTLSNTIRSTSTSMTSSTVRTSRAFYIKHFLVPDWRTRLRQWLRRSKGRNEARRARYLDDLRVPTIVPLAVGERRRFGFVMDNYLLTEEVDGASPLDRFLETVLPTMSEPRQRRVRLGLVDRLAELIAHLHDRGVLHQDFHQGNLMVRLDEGDQVRLTLIDLDALRFRDRPVVDAEAVRNLSLLHHAFWMQSRRAERLRFLQGYEAHRSSSGLGRRALARRVERVTRAWAERLWVRWGRRAVGTNKYFEQIEVNTHCASISRTVSRSAIADLLRDPAGWLVGSLSDPGRVLKTSRTTTVFEASLDRGGQITPVIVKWFHHKKPLERLLDRVRPSRALRAWLGGQHMASRAVPTPENLAWVRLGPRVAGPLTPVGRRPRRGEQILITRKAEPAVTLDDYLRGLARRDEGPTTRLQRRRVIRSLARLIRTLHERSLCHRDLKFANILIAEPPAAEDVDPEYALSLIDLVGLEVAHPLPESRRVQNLARLATSFESLSGRRRTEALRFLKDYLPWAWTDRATWKRLWRLVERRVEAKRRQNRRRGRALS